MTARGVPPSLRTATNASPPGALSTTFTCASTGGSTISRTAGVGVLHQQPPGLQPLRGRYRIVSKDDDIGGLVAAVVEQGAGGALGVLGDSFDRAPAAEADTAALVQAPQHGRRNRRQLLLDRRALAGDHRDVGAALTGHRRDLHGEQPVPGHDPPRIRVDDRPQLTRTSEGVDDPDPVDSPQIPQPRSRRRLGADREDDGVGRQFTLSCGAHRPGRDVEPRRMITSQVMRSQALLARDDLQHRSPG